MQASKTIGTSGILQYSKLNRLDSNICLFSDSAMNYLDDLASLHAGVEEPVAEKSGHDGWFSHCAGLALEPAYQIMTVLDNILTSILRDIFVPGPFL
jgi:hypothetical protein